MTLFPEWIQYFTKTFPYAIPSFVIFCMGIVAFVLGIFRLHETNKHSWYYRKFVADSDPSNSTVSKTDVFTSRANLLKNEDKFEEEDAPVQIEKSRFARFLDFLRDVRSNELLSTRAPLLTCFLYMLLGCKQIMFDECLPLFAVMPIDQGGLGFSSYNLGSKYYCILMCNLVSCWWCVGCHYFPQSIVYCAPSCFQVWSHCVL